MIKTIVETTTWYITKDNQRFRSEGEAIQHNRDLKNQMLEKDILDQIFEYNAKIDRQYRLDPSNTIYFLENNADQLVPILERYRNS